MSLYKPVRQRRKYQPCVLCKEEETRDWDRVCIYCRQIWREGKEYRAVGLPKGTREVLVAWHWALYEFYGVARRHDSFGEHNKGARARFRDAVMALVGATRRSDKWSPKLSAAIGLPKNKRGTDAVSRYIIVGDEKTEQAMRDLYEAACDLMAEVYKKGEARGKSFIADLVEGKLTTKDLERL